MQQEMCRALKFQCLMIALYIHSERTFTVLLSIVQAFLHRIKLASHFLQT
jgi:hypothetical protein